MTDIIDYKVDSLAQDVFDPVDNQQNVETSDKSAVSNTNSQYLDVVQLIQTLTSHSDIDYNLISDFFLTYRSFMSQLSLLKLLILKLKWSINLVSDESHEARHDLGKLSLVRLFVVIRHWLLNYFMDDFIPFLNVQELIVEFLNNTKSENFFIQRIISNLKKYWVQCSNKVFNEKVTSDDYYSFKISIISTDSNQNKQSKRLSTIALNQQSDPVTRNTIVLSTFDKSAIHRLPIPISIKHTKLQPKALLHPKNSNLRLSILALSAANTDANNTTATSTQTKALYRPLTGLMSSPNNRIRGESDFPNDSKPTNFLPPTPVKKMDFNVKLPKQKQIGQDNHHKGLKPLIESWLKTFTNHNSKNNSAEKFMRNVVSIPKSKDLSLINKDLEKIADGKFDILSARTIDELEYLVQFHNNLLNKYGSDDDSVINLTKNSFSFTNDDLTSPFGINTGAGVSNIDNLNLCECLTNISKSMVNLSLQQNRSKIDILHDDQISKRNDDAKSYISYSSALSKSPIKEVNESNMNSNVLIKKKPKIDNLKQEFNFDNFEPNNNNYHDFNDNNKENEFCFENVTNDNEASSESSSLKTFPLSVISQSTLPEMIASQQDEKKKQQQQQVPKDKNVNLPAKEQELLSDSDYEEIESFVSSYENIESMDDNVEGIDSNLNKSDSDNRNITTSSHDEPITPPLIARSPIKSVHDSKTTSDLVFEPTGSQLVIESTGSHQQSEPQSETQHNLEELDLNKVPSFTKISNDSISSKISSIISVENEFDNDEYRNSYLSSRANFKNHGLKAQPKQKQIKNEIENNVQINESSSTIFSESGPKVLNISYKEEKEADETDEEIIRTREEFLKSASTLPSPNSKLNDSKIDDVLHNNSGNKSSVDLIPSMVSDDYFVPYSGVNTDVVAELAAISDESATEDPIEAALLKLEGTYVKKHKMHHRIGSNNLDVKRPNSISSNELLKQVEQLSIASKPLSLINMTSPDKRRSVFIDQRRKTKLLSLTPVAQKQISYYDDSNNSKILLEVLLSHKISNESLKISNSENHISFILNFDSQTLAKQFTLIEKDSLLEIDWKELIELKWNSKEILSINSWLEFLVQNEEIRGVDLCVSRFNLTVNWIISEILLTKNLTLRKLTIQRFIHVAQNCKTLQNYSTLMQILLALGSDKIMKLKETWRNLEPGDILIYKNLEAISSPFKNFFNLRKEINSLKPSLGCIPFLGLYLSDLIFNKEKSSVKQGNLINFNKFRTNAKVVKSLIQCIQWSSLYNFKVEEDVLSKCLYIKALTEEEMDECLKEVN